MVRHIKRTATPADFDVPHITPAAGRKMTADPLLPFITSVRVGNNVARRLGAFYQGTHYTGIDVNEENLAEILDRRDAINDWLMRQLSTSKGVLIAQAVCLIDDLERVTGNDNGLEIAHCDYGARRRLADAVMVMGRLESFRWFLDRDFKVRDIRRIMSADEHWRNTMWDYVPTHARSEESAQVQAAAVKSAQEACDNGPRIKKPRPAVRRPRY